ncbi:IS1595 family transposase, partial [Coprobacillus sp. BIOML-A1]|nr:IS1595 family transposase [Coprobacillus sp. BIOML-A1]
MDYEISGLTLKDEAYFMNTSITTCFYMRHKLYKTASQIIQEQKLSNEIEIDSQYLSINLKETKLENIPRYSKKRGKQSAYRGISHHKVCVTCAIDSQDNIMMNIVGLGSESFEKYMSVINRLDNVKKLISDTKSCFKQFSNELKAENSYIKTSPTQKHYLTEDGNSLASVNELMSEIENIIQRTHGFSTRYAQEYLDFNILRK